MGNPIERGGGPACIDHADDLDARRVEHRRKSARRRIDVVQIDPVSTRHRLLQRQNHLHAGRRKRRQRRRIQADVHKQRAGTLETSRGRNCERRGKYVDGNLCVRTQHAGWKSDLRPRAEGLISHDTATRADGTVRDQRGTVDNDVRGKTHRCQVRRGETCLIPDSVFDLENRRLPCAYLAELRKDEALLPRAVQCTAGQKCKRRGVQAARDLLLSRWAGKCHAMVVRVAWSVW